MQVFSSLKSLLLMKTRRLGYRCRPGASKPYGHPPIARDDQPSGPFDAHLRVSVGHGYSCYIERAIQGTHDPQSGSVSDCHCRQQVVVVAHSQPRRGDPEIYR